LAKEGKIFEANVENSSKEQKIFYFRVRDVMLPPDVRLRVRLPKNKYDCLMHHNGHLFSIEMKSVKSKSISFAESMIKQNQIDNLADASTYDDVIAGFIFNFRLDENLTYFVGIQEFLKYKNIAENQLEHNYISKVTRSSIPIGICKEIGHEIKSAKKKVNYRYFIKNALENLIEVYGDKS